MSPPAPDVEELLRPYVPELLLAWPADMAWQEREGTLVSADISGFTALSERLAGRGREGAEELSRLICDCFDGMIEDAVGRGGDIIKFGGDALLVWFEGEGHARRAASAAIAMRRTIRQPRRTSDGRRVALSISIGVNSGAHHFIQIVGEVPDLIVTGPGATATVQAESEADAGMILVTASTASQLPERWRGEAHGAGVVLRRRDPDPPGEPVHPVTPLRAPSTFVPAEQRHGVLAGISNEHRQVAVSFVTFAGADEIVTSGRLGLLAERLQQVTSAVAEACERNGTHLLATDIAPDGGKYVIAAGAPRALGNNEDRLLRTVREIVDADPGLDLHAGVNRGALFAGDLGSRRRRVYTTLGDATNLSARLAGRANAGEILVSQVALDWSSQEFDVDAVAPFHVKGKSRPVHAALLREYVGHRSERLDAGAAFVGRDGELQRIGRLIAAAADGTSRGVLVIGEPGIGKTRLLGELQHRFDDVRTVVMRCSILDRAHGRSAIADVIRALLDVPFDHPAGDVIERFRRLGGERFPSSVALLPLLGPILDIDLDDTTESARVPLELRATRTAQLLVELVTALIDRHTLLLVDDLHHADATSAEAIALLCGAGVSVPLCTVAVTTREQAPEIDVVEIGPLSRTDTTRLVDAIVGDAELASDTLRDVLTRSDGNPMFATELVKAVLDGAVGIPDSLDAAVESRFDRLDPTDRHVLRTAAVLGPEVDLTILAALLPRPVLSDTSRWERLAEFLDRVGPGVVRFRFDTHRRVAYEALPFRTRRDLHRAVLEFLEAQPGVPGRERQAMMAHHASVSGDEAAMWRHATAAAAKSAELGLFRDAAQLYRLAWRARKSVPDEELVAVAERAGDALEVAGDFEAAAETYGRALNLSADPLSRARLMRKRGDVAERQGEYNAAHGWYRRAARELDGLNWAAVVSEQAQLDCARSGLAYRQSHFSEAWRFGNLALGQAERVEDWDTAAHAALMVDNLITQMTWSGAHVSRPDVIGLHERAGNLLGAARWLSNQAVDRYYEGAWDDAVAMYRESAEQCARFGHLVSEATAINNIGEIESDRGRYDEALTLFRAARRSWRAIGFGVGIALAQSNLGRLATRTGDHADAEPLLTEAIDRFDALDMASMAGDARLRRIENALLSGAPVPRRWWPSDADLDDDVVAQIYRRRLRAVEAFVLGRRPAASKHATAAVERARAASVPFDLVLALRVRRAITGTTDDDAEIETIDSRLGIVRPPAVLPGPNPVLAG